MTLFTSNWLILFPVAFSLFVAMRLSQGSVDDGRASWMVLAVKCVIANMFAFSLLALGTRGNFLSLNWSIVIGAFAFVFFWKKRRLERNAVFMTALSAKNLNQQQTLAGYFVDENVGWIRRKATALRRDLALGVPWARALETRRIAQGVYERLALRLQATYGDDPNENFDHHIQPTHVLSPLQIEAEAERLIGRLMVFLWVIVIFPIIFLIMAFVVPTFQDMFEEFELQLPMVTQVMVDVANFSWNTGLAYIIGLLPLLLMGLAFMGFVIWMFPAILQMKIFRWICADYYRNAGFAALSRVLQKEENLAIACQRTAEVVPVPHVSRMFENASIRLNQGDDLPSAFRKARLLKGKELEVFSSFTKSSRQIKDAGGSAIPGASSRASPVMSSDVLWGLQQHASSRIERMLSRYSAIVQVLVVLITFVIAAIVALVAIGLISALTSLILSLA